MDKLVSKSKHSKQKILIADDEAGIRRILEMRLSMVGYSVVTAIDGEEALERFHQHHPDLVVLDVMMPKLDGYGVCQALRKESNVPIILLTALVDVADRIIGFEAGADDYMMKPFSPKELESRIHCILRRVEKPSDSLPIPGVVQIGSLKIDNNQWQAYLNGVSIGLTHLEFNLLRLLVSRAGECLSRSEILENVWGYLPERFGDIRLVDVHLSRLREKLQESSNQPEFILTIRGKGYAFQRFEQ